MSIQFRSSTPPRQIEQGSPCHPSPDPVCCRRLSLSSTPPSTPKRQRDSEEPSSSSCTPLRQPRIDSGTPTPVRVVLEQLHQEGTPSGPAVNGALEYFCTNGTPEKMVTYARRLYGSIFSPSKPENDENLKRKHENFLGLVDRSAPLALLAEGLRRIEVRLDPLSAPLCTVPVRYDHLLAPDKKGGGWHILRKGEEVLPLVNPVVSLNGTLYAGFVVSEKLKYSTFFPPERISSLALLDALIQKNRHFERVGNRGLCYSKEQDLYFEVCYKNNECITTAYPFFFVGKYQEDQEYSIIRGVPPLEGFPLLYLEMYSVQRVH